MVLLPYPLRQDLNQIPSSPTWLVSLASFLWEYQVCHHTRAALLSVLESKLWFSSLPLSHLPRLG